MKLTLYQIISGFLSLFLVVSVSANVIEYGQKLNEAEWKVTDSKKSCKLFQKIPLYGIAEFEQKYRNKGLEFSIYIIRVPEQVIDAKISSMPPKWNHTTLLRPIGKVKLKASNKTLSLNHKLSMRVIAELEDGMFPTLMYQSWMDEDDDIRVSVSPINFRERLPKFLECVAGLTLMPVVMAKLKPKLVDIIKLLPVKKPIVITKIVEESEPDTFYFAADSANLNSKAKNKLKTLAKKLKKDKKTKHIIISGYSDDVGNKTKSTSISKQRALTVQAYLEKQGISSKHLFTRYFGRDHAILSNSTVKGRAKNRRVHIDIIRSNLKSAR